MTAKWHPLVASTGWSETVTATDEPLSAIGKECSDFVQESIATVHCAIQVHKMRRVGQSQDADGGCVSCIVGERLHVLRPTPEISIRTYEQNVRSDRGSIEESPTACLIEAIFDCPQGGAKRRRLVCAGAGIALQ